MIEQFSAAVVTTFPNGMWDIYARKMLQSFVTNWPAEIPLLVALDNDALAPDVDKIIRPQDALAIGPEPDHAAFIQRNHTKDHPSDYRKQAVRFCHKVFAIHRAVKAIAKQTEGIKPRYLIWMDADVLTTRKVTLADIEAALPKEGDAVSYLGRKDWPHSECGWLAFDLENSGDMVIDAVFKAYCRDEIFNHEQWHDSWIFDRVRASFTIENQAGRWTNLTADKPGIDIWQHSPMAAWSTHYKGPVAKAQLGGQPVAIPQGQRTGNVTILTKNSLPDATIQRHVRENQKQITRWLQPCKENNEEIVVCSAGTTLIPEDLREEVKAGRKIVAVKHALTPLKAAGITPWACILLDPREHVANFVDEPDKDIIWLVASQVDPRAVKKLLDAGCTVWGYHAAVGAGEIDLIRQQEASIVSGGSATATRGLFLLDMLGFRKFRLYGYDLALPDKPDLDARDEQGQPKYLEFSIQFSHPASDTALKRAFWSEPQYIAQYQEMTEIINKPKWTFKAFGWGIVPFLVTSKNVLDLREQERKAKIAGKITNYNILLSGGVFQWLCLMAKTVRNRFYRLLQRALPLSLLKRNSARNLSGT